jgi:predicted MFS family arabinose efflux permease
MAVGWGSVTFILALLFFVDRFSQARRRAQKEVRNPATISFDLPGLTVRQAIRSWTLWRVALSNLIVMVLTIGLSIHLFPILTESGLAHATAAWLLSLGGIAAIVGKLISGVLLDRYRPNWVGAITLGIASIAFILLMEGVRSYALIVIALVINGYAAGTQTQMVSYMTANFGGMKNFGVIYGTMSALLAIATGFGPLTAAWIYDTSGSYEPFLAMGAVGCFLGGLLILSLPRYPTWEKTRITEPGAAATAS